MLSSKRERFAWSKADRVREVSFFRQLHQKWHPTTRLVVVEELVVSGRYRSSSAIAKAQAASKTAWSPWLWVGS